MSTLTKKERDGLEEVFLSISSNKSNYQILSKIPSLIFTNKSKINPPYLFKRAKLGLKKVKNSLFTLNFNKKKKFLSK